MSRFVYEAVKSKTRFSAGWAILTSLLCFAITGNAQPLLGSEPVPIDETAASAPETERESLFRDGDRITLLGGTYIERLQAFNYFETWLVASHPSQRFSFRNLGWSGDDVWGTARAVFGTQADGFERLKTDLEATRPTLILICYGANESFAGIEGLPAFTDGLQALIDMLESTGARIAFVTPYRFEKTNLHQIDTSRLNADIDRYAERLGKIVRKRGHVVIDFETPLRERMLLKNGRPVIRDRLTENGIHFTPYGYWRTALELARRMGVRQVDRQWSFNADLQNETYEMTGGMVSDVEITPDGLRVTILDEILPFAAPPPFSPKGAKLVAPVDRIQVEGLPPGKYGLRIDDRPTLMAPASQWADGVVLNRGGYLDQFDRLRDVIREKNELYFHRYRPQNETYLLLFRKHEQGNNAVEIPRFDPLVEEKEELIERLKQPTEHLYQWVRIDEADSTGE